MQLGIKIESEKDFKIRKALAWKVCNKMRTLWKSVLYASLKIIFQESILIRWAKGWKLTTKLEVRLDGCYTRMMMMVLDLNWKDHPTIWREIYESLPSVRERRLNFAAHCSRRQNITVSELVFWTTHKNVVPKGDYG